MDVQIKTFQIASEADEHRMNEFLRNKIVRHWATSFAGTEDVSNSNGSWHILVAFEERQQRLAPQNATRKPSTERKPAQPKREKGPSSDYVPAVPAEDMPLFEAVRKWRNARAREENIKPFTLFNNKQLEDIVKAKPLTLDLLKPLAPDMAAEYMERYGNELLGFVSAAATVTTIDAVATDTAAV